jgi:predicted AAA+ superfamily ATPase
MEDMLPLLIPIIGVSIPLVVVIGRFIVQPILQSLNRHAELQATPRDDTLLLKRLEATEERLHQLEKSVDRVLEEQEFQNKLLSGRQGSGIERSLTRRDTP